MSWLENIRIGQEGKEIFNLIEIVLPKQIFGWELNPGHYVSDEEWISSPFYPNSQATVKSVQLFQIDIITKVAGYGRASAEDGIVIADKKLRNELVINYPETWQRIARRQNYLKNELNIAISDDILPLNDVVAYYRPYLLNQEMVFSVE